MPIRLLPKKEIDRAKATDRAREVEEGRKLAQRVDSLREIAANEEASLQKFRNETIKKINEEITVKTKEKEDLVAEVATLKRDRAEALRPITEELVSLEKRKKEIEEDNTRLEAKENSLEEQQEVIREALHAAKQERQKARADMELSNDHLLESERKLKLAEKAVAETHRIKESIALLKEEVEADLRKRDLLMATRERSCTIREARIEQDFRELEKEKIKIKDRKEMLDRQFIRSKKLNGKS